jgi:hypothetical protein
VALLTPYVMLLASLYYLIRPQQQRGRNGEAERFGGLEIDHEVERRRFVAPETCQVRTSGIFVDVVARRHPSAMEVA